MSARLAILGLLVERPRHGYAIDRVIEERGMRRWAGLGFSSIYWVLDRLVANGLAEVAEVQTSGRAGGRTVFRATDDGVRSWTDESLAALADLDRPVEALFLALSGLPGLDRRTARASLERRLAAIDARLAEIADGAGRAGPSAPAHVDELFLAGRALLEAQREWLRGLLEERWPRVAALQAATGQGQATQEVTA